MTSTAVIKVSNAVRFLPGGIVYDLALTGFIVTDNCLIYLVNGERHLRLHPVAHSVPQSYEEIVGRHGTRFKLFFIIYGGHICELSMFRFSPYADTIGHGVINALARFVY